jgi:hypothetical protein
MMHGLKSLDSAGLQGRWPGFDSRQGTIFLIVTTTRPSLVPTHPSTEWILGTLFPGVKRQGREASYPPPSNAEVKNGGDIPPLPHVSSQRAALLINHGAEKLFNHTK